MKKRFRDEETGRKAIMFFYPLNKVAELVTKETAYRVKLLVETNQKVPQSLVFHNEDDNFWLNNELPKVLTSLTSVFLKMAYGINPEYALFFDYDVDGKTSAGFSVNDYGRAQNSLVDSIDKQMEAAIIAGLSYTWFQEKGQLETASLYERDMIKYGANSFKAIELLKKKRKQLLYPAEDSDFWGDDYNMKPGLNNYLND